jgi:phage-related minor tail protein
LVDPANQITGAASAIGDAFSQSFINAITGATTAKQALADFFKSVASYFLDMAKQIIAKMITIAILNAFTGLLPGGSGGSGGNLNLAEVSNYSGVGADTRVPTPDFRANGGPVSANQPYIVGERGPELFVPSRSGSIVPNDRLGGGDNVSVVVNVDAKGTSVQGNDQEGNQLGLVLSAAVKAELIKQKRPGGLLA